MFAWMEFCHLIFFTLFPSLLFFLFRFCHSLKNFLAVYFWHFNDLISITFECCAQTDLNELLRIINIHQTFFVRWIWTMTTCMCLCSRLFASRLERVFVMFLFSSDCLICIPVYLLMAQYIDLLKNHEQRPLRLTSAHQLTWHIHRHYFHTLSNFQRWKILKWKEEKINVSRIFFRSGNSNCYKSLL